ncbi:hypothetical protein BGZ80_002262 [Entomortierella chlamydospora]|uniref:Uncharacterized protein n=1 Tax=Entomortierella chlamydospora TaxID=101097 RepID=A0A9P6SX77_9FUNG|nr:hypothetical protein BGZ79_002114 [Entomortierella chlamydospora]KAG0009567.1 hypothetical protein BGZ80_002262 [Entomortierella chlamydospora]
MNGINRSIPLIVAIGVGVMSGFYIWEPVLKKYQRESKGTWNYEVVQQTRAEELNHHANAVAEATGATTTQTTTATTGAPAEKPASTPSVASSPEADKK